MFAVGEVAHIIEKIAMAIVIIVCLILFVVGISNMINASYASGITCLILGVVGGAGSIYWVMHPITPSLSPQSVGQGIRQGFLGLTGTTGHGEDWDGGEEWENLNDDINYIATTGGHEKEMLRDLDKMLEYLEGDDEELPPSGILADHNKDAVSTIEEICKKLDSADVSKFKDLDKKRDKAIEVLNSIRTLSKDMSTKSSELAEKLKSFEDKLKA
jgi:hypothetical protein